MIAFYGSGLLALLKVNAMNDSFQIQPGEGQSDLCRVGACTPPSLDAKLISNIKVGATPTLLL